MDSIRITLGDKSFDARPTFGAIERIETQTGRSFTALGSDLLTLRISDMATVLHAAIAETGHAITRSEVGELLVRAGFNAAATETAKIVNAIFNAAPKEAPPQGDTKSDDS